VSVVIAAVAFFAAAVSAVPGGDYGYSGTDQNVDGFHNKGGNDGGLLNGLLGDGIANDNSDQATAVQAAH
ncbi:hypothetical protein DFQ28_000736, partial [Apophysomyces sp. BC1034]